MQARLRIAVIDDDDSVRVAIRRLLVASGLEVSAFASGPEFLEVVAPDAFECVLIDLNMPVLTGLDVLKELTKRRLDLPAIVITSYDEPRSQAQCLASGARAYMRKPLEAELLFRTIAEATGTNFRDGG